MDGGLGPIINQKNEETQPYYSDDHTSPRTGLNPVPEEQSFELVRDVEKVEARKKSDSISRARPVSTASIDSTRHGSVSKRPFSVARDDSIAEADEPNDVPPETAEDTSSNQAQPLQGRRGRRRPLSATSGSKTDSSPENSLSSYSIENEFGSPTASVTISIEAFTTMQKKIHTLEETVDELKNTFEETVDELKNTFEETVDELKAANTELKKRLRSLELNGPHKDVDAPKTTSEELIASIPEHSKCLNQSTAHRTSTNSTISAVSAPEEMICDEAVAMPTTVIIPCEPQTSTKSTNSAPFFSDKDNSGYQMCVNLRRSGYLNAELTFALVIMRGKYDKNLPWPFNRKIILTVISSDASKNKAITIQPNSEKPFQCPKSDLNEPYTFLKQYYTMLYDGGFVNDDNKVTVCVTVT